MLLVIHQRLDFRISVIREGNHLAAVHGSYFGIALHQIPLGREFTQLFVFEVILKEYLVSGDKVAFGILRRCLLLGLGSLRARLLGAAIRAELTSVAGFATFGASPGGIGGGLGRLGSGLGTRLGSAAVVAELAGIAGFTAFLAGPGGGGGRGFRSFFALLLILLVLLSHFSVQDVIHALFHFLAEILFGGVFGFFAQSFQKTLGISRPANQGQDGEREQ